MNWPDPTDYNDAIQLPAVNLNDPELKEAEVETDMLGLPKVAAGSFASVYHLRRGDKAWAVKCFFRNIPERRERYQRICAAIQEARVPYLIACEYQEEGIRVGADWFPILKMPWADGIHLNQFVAQWRNKPKVLDMLGNEWLKMLGALGKRGIAHGDLQHGNVLIVNRRLRLVDYDGMYVPALAGEKSIEGGHPEYQHPARGGAFGPDLDRFAALAIYTAIRALTHEPDLWDTTNIGENMLFRRADYEVPPSSALFERLLSHREDEIRRLAEVLRKACEDGVDAVAEVLDLAEVKRRVTPAPSDRAGLGTRATPERREAAEGVPISCPNCNAATPGGTTVCVRCGAHLVAGREPERERRGVQTTGPTPVRNVKRWLRLAGLGACRWVRTAKRLARLAGLGARRWTRTAMRWACMAGLGVRRWTRVAKRWARLAGLGARRWARTAKRWARLARLGACRWTRTAKRWACLAGRGARRWARITKAFATVQRERLRLPRLHRRRKICVNRLGERALSLRIEDDRLRECYREVDMAERQIAQTHAQIRAMSGERRTWK